MLTKSRGVEMIKRRLTSYSVPGPKNSLQYWFRIVNPVRVMVNFAIIQFCRYCPSLALKNILYRLIGIKVGKNVSSGLMAMIDIFFPQYVCIGDNTILGYNSTILCHEFLIKEYRLGRVEIGKNVMIGANATILPGVVIGDGAVVAAGSLVNRDIPAGSFAAGVPVEIREKSEEVGFENNGSI